MSFVFDKNPETFFVREETLYPPDPKAAPQHLLIFVQKKGLTTPQMLNIFGEILGVKTRDIGYAGLKDKLATTQQHVSIPVTFDGILREKIPLLAKKNIQILKISPFQNKLKIGHLRGNFFRVILRVNDALALENSLKFVAKNPEFLNFFGEQRFGRDGQNFLRASHKTPKNPRVAKFLQSSFQSYFFNEWLKIREKINEIFALDPKKLEKNLQNLALNFSQDEILFAKKQPQFFKFFPGDLAMHYPFGRVFCITPQDFHRFLAREISPVANLNAINNGSGVSKRIFEKFLLDPKAAQNSYRYAIVWAQNLKFLVNEHAATLEFFLPKGAYATVFLAHVKKIAKNFRKNPEDFQ